MTRKALTMMLSVAMLALVACASEPSGSDSTPGVVKVVDYTFSPPEMKIAVGQTVTWNFADEAGHDVVSTDRTFQSEVLSSGGKYSFTFTRAGTFDYFCSIHPYMKGKVIVG